VPIKTKRWDDPAEPDDGFRLLVCRYRPRGIAKSAETWDAWEPKLGPSKDLHAGAYGKKGAMLLWPSYERLYLSEMRDQAALIEKLAKRVGAGETITLLCSSACVRESRCHRSLLKMLIERQVASTSPPSIANSHSRGFSLIEVLVAIGIITILMGLLIAAVEHARHQAYITDCASNLRQIGAAVSLYCNENHGNYPRTRYVPDAALVKGTGASAADAFRAGGPDVNDLTAPWFLLMRVEKVPAVCMLCAYNDVNVFEPDKANPQTHANFTDYKKNLGYSFANPYPDAAAVKAGYHLTSKVSSQLAVAADLNPGVDKLRKKDDVTAAAPGVPWSVMKKGNSENHEKDGQNVLFGDGHVDWVKSPLVGIAGDNIYINKKNDPAEVEAPPVDKNDAVLLPAQ
jgi:prepilin-type N-terminal cleavage/methylation domain-containing protein/prepilin-type processing-associated H-X9-DG protein